MSLSRPLKSVTEKLEKLRRDVRSSGESILEGFRPLENIRPIRNVLRRRKKRD